MSGKRALRLACIFCYYFALYQKIFYCAPLFVVTKMGRADGSNLFGYVRETSFLARKRDLRLKTARLASLEAMRNAPRVHSEVG